MGLGGRGLRAEFGGPGPRAPRPSWASGAGGGAMQADPTPERSSRVLTPDPEPGPGSESILDPEQDARAALAEFATLHGPALRASGVPERYWGRLLHKLEHEVRVGAPRGEARGAERARGAPGKVWVRALAARTQRPERAAGVGGSGLFYLGGCGQRAGSGPRTARVGRPGSPPAEDTRGWGSAPGEVGGVEMGGKARSRAGLGETRTGRVGGRRGWTTQEMHGSGDLSMA